MNPRATLILVLAAAAAIVAVVWHEGRSGSLREEILREGRLFARDVEGIESVLVQTGAMETHLQRDEKGWRLASPIHDSADPGVTGQLLSALRDLKPMQSLEPGTGEMRKLEFSDLGLVEPKTRVELGWNDGARTKLSFGREGPYEHSVYCRVDDDPLAHLVPVGLRDLLASAPDGFRDRRLFNRTPEEVQKVVIQRDDGQVVIERAQDGWQMSAPTRSPASTEGVEALLRGLSRARIAAFLDSGKSNPGSDQHTSMSVQVYTDERNTPFEAAFFSITPEDPPASDLVAARLSPRGLRVWLPAAMVEGLRFPPALLRERVLARINLDTVDRVLLSGGELRTVLHREAGSWMADDGDGSPVPADPTLLEGLVSLLADSEGVQTVGGAPALDERFGFGAPALRIDFTSVLSENTPHTSAGEHPVAVVEFGARAQPASSESTQQPASEMIYARTVPDGPILTIPAARFDAIRVDKGFWEDRRMFPIDPEQIQEISFTPANGFPASWQRRNGDWQQREGARSMPADVVDAVAVMLATLRLPEADESSKPVQPPERNPDFLVKFSWVDNEERERQEALDVWIYQDGILGRHDVESGPLYCGFTPTQQTIFSRAVSAAGF